MRHDPRKEKHWQIAEKYLVLPLAERENATHNFVEENRGLAKARNISQARLLMSPRRYVAVS